MRYFDAHCHLQDPRISGRWGEIAPLYRSLGIQEAVVNGTCEADWELVANLCESDDRLRPSFGLHPWRVAEASEDWQAKLLQLWQRYPRAGVGEIGLDRWIEGHDLEAQVPVFQWQMEKAAALDRPVSVHCLRAWGKLRELLEKGPVPEGGFLLHSYGGPKELVGPLARLGAYFSISGYFAHARKSSQREALRQIPIDRLLIETDAPNMSGPDSLQAYRFDGDEELNHPGNLVAVYRFVASLFELSEEALAKQAEANYRRFFDRR